MKKSSFTRWLLSTIVLITATFLSHVNPTIAATPLQKTSPGIATDMPSALLLTTATEQIPIVMNYQVTVIIQTENSETQFAETPAILKMPQIYAKKISYASGNTAMTGKNYRGKQPFNRMM